MTVGLAAVRRALRDRWLLRPATDGRIVVDRRHIYILPTAHGIGFGLLLLLMLAGSINYSNSLGFMLTFLLVGVALVAMLQGYRNLLGLELVASAAEPVFAGEIARFPLHLHSPQGGERSALRIGFAAGEKVDSRLEEGAGAIALLPLVAERRGRLRPGRVRLASDHPLGLFEAWTWFDPGFQAIIYPRPESPAAPLPLSSAGEEEGEMSGDGDDDFAGLRPYRHGDPLRHVAWKAVARGQPLLVKQFEGEEGSTLWFDWATLGNMGVEQRLSRLCRWVVEAEGARVDYALRLPGFELAPDHGPQQRDRALSALAIYGESGE